MGFAGLFDGNGFSYAGGGFSGIVGGTPADIDAVGFKSAGQSLGLHSQNFEFDLSSDFASLDPEYFGLYRVNLQANVVSALVAGVPEPATWGLMIAGFGMIGPAMRRRAAVAA